MWLDERLEAAHRILILGHVRPDGDCVGSTLGLKNYIEDNWPEKKAVLCLEEFSPDFRMLPGSDSICREPDQKEKEAGFDLCVSVDVSSVDRLGACPEFFSQADHTICLDHHMTNPGFADENIVEAFSSSASELLYTLMDPEKVSERTAECLYLGIVHDTGVFKHTNTTKRTMETAGALIEKGVPAGKIIDDTFYRKTFLQNRILGHALLKAQLLAGGRYICSAVTADEMERYGARSLDLEGIIDQLRVTAGVKIAALVHETGKGDCKVSLRSCEEVSAAAVAVVFGGGGHDKAAGCTIPGAAEEACQKLLAAVQEELARHE